MRVGRNISNSGFTLIELMTVVAIIGVLATIAMSIYTRYAVMSANRACMFEVRHYVTEVMIALNDPIGGGGSIPSPTYSACLYISDAVDLATPVTGQPQPPGEKTIICDIPTTSCDFTE